MCIIITSTFLLVHTFTGYVLLLPHSILASDRAVSLHIPSVMTLISYFRTRQVLLSIGSIANSMFNLRWGCTVSVSSCKKRQCYLLWCFAVDLNETHERSHVCNFLRGSCSTFLWYKWPIAQHDVLHHNWSGCSRSLYNVFYEASLFH